jgi:hypothetical protein
MNNDSADALVARGFQLREDRAVYDRKAAEIAAVMRPTRAEFTGILTADAKRTSRLFDGTAILAAQNLAGGLYGTMTNPSNVWAGFQTMDDDLNRSYRAKKWLQTVSFRALQSFGPSFSRFYSEVSELYLDVPVFGMGCMSSELRQDLSGFNDLCRPMSEVFHDINEDGEVDTVFRIWKTTVGKAKAKWEADGKKRLSDRVRAKKDTDEIELMHATLPSKTSIAQEFAVGENKPFLSIYLECDAKHKIQTEGYYELPYMIPFWTRAARERNGRGIGENALPDTNSLQAAQKANLNMGARMASPVIMAPNEGVIKTLRLKPDAVVFGAMSSRGQPLLQPMNLGGNVPYTMEQIQQLRDAIKDFFFFSIMQLVGRTGMTATEIIERQEERLRLMAPFVGNIQEFLARLWLRRYRMMTRVPGLVPPPPPELAHHSLQVSFTSPMAMVQKSQTATAVLRTWSAIEPMAAVQPEILDRWNGEQASQIVSEGFGAPIDVWFDDDTTAQRRQAREQASAKQAQIEAAAMGAKAARDGAAAVSAASPAAA